MAQFRIKTSKSEVLCPSEMEKHEKKSLFDKCKDEKLKLFCIVGGNKMVQLLWKIVWRFLKKTTSRTAI